MSLEKKYNPEEYWSEIGSRIGGREDKNIIAGDDSPFYRYKRKEFLKLLHEVPFQNCKVLEIGGGPGGNLLEVMKHKPTQLHDADISAEMLALAKKNTAGHDISFTKTNGTQLPFDDESFDIVFSATVLQHNTDPDMMKALLKEMCRVSTDKVIIFERIEKRLKGDDLCMGRPIEYYAKVPLANGFNLDDSKFINIQASYLVSGAARKLLNPPSREEGQKLSALAKIVQSISLPITSVLDKVFPAKRDLARLTFVRKK